MQPIPLPQLLDPDRLLLDDRNDLSAEQHADRAAQLDRSLHETCSYAQQLWHELDSVRGYLLDSLPPGSRPSGPAAAADRRNSTAPAGPDDEQGWQNWITAYSRVTSVLAGPHGDSGFGLDEARREARDRRVEPAEAEGAYTQPSAGRAEAIIAAVRERTGESPANMPAEPPARRRRPVRLALRVAVLALAVRGLRR